MRVAEDKFLYIGPYAVKRGVKIVKRAVKDTVKKLAD